MDVASWLRSLGLERYEAAFRLKLDWHTVKALEQHYMEAQLKRAGTPSPQV